MNKLNKSELNRMARKLTKEGKRGWLTPTGDFFPAGETPPVRMAGLELDGHEQAALAYLEQHEPAMCERLYQLRVKQGFETWEETDGHDVIKRFMFKHGFMRVAAD